MLDEVRHQDSAVVFLQRFVDGTLSNPLLLVGPTGTGRRYAVMLAIRQVFCSGDGTLVCRCVDCVQLEQGCHPDLFQLAAEESKDIGVDAVRDLLEWMGSYPTQSRYRVVLIDGADRLTPAAANAFLKTLEEPPSTARVFMLSESLRRVLPTIRSRCGLLQFHSLPEDFVLSRVQKFESDATKALVYARLGEGSVGRAIQYWGSGRLALRDKAFNLLSLSLAKDLAGVFSLIDQLEKDLPLALRFLGTLIHDLLLLDVDPQRAINLDLLNDLKSMSGSTTSWQRFHTALQAVVAASRGARVQLPFHTKTLFVETFFEV